MDRNKETFNAEARAVAKERRVLERATLWDWPYWRLPRRPTVRLLIVVDDLVGLGADYFFGVGKVIEILRKNAPHDTDTGFGFVRFEVETASRDESPINGTATYTEFRFDRMVDGQPLINRFDQIWCFGFHPGNTGFNVDDSIESNPTSMTDSELRTLTKWMNERKGGVLAMGDHHFLGATLAWKIPRVRAMRRWTNAQGVPPINGPITSPGGATRYRHDTNQPQNAAQADPSSSAVIPRAAEEDDIPQKIDVRRYGAGLFKRPHPILCGGKHGTIDILPDHPHEGWIYEDDEVDDEAAYDFGSGVAGQDFPHAVDGGSRPLPQVIAWANPFPEPPYDHEKQATPVDRFAVINAYDGHRANVGRTVCDSTWHHWFNMNLDGIEQAADGSSPAQDKAWAKIKTYYRNVAVWLSPPLKQRAMLAYAAFWSCGSGPAMEGYDGGMPTWELGETARDILGQSVNDCTLLDWILPDLPFEVAERFRFPPPDPCLTCPPFDLIINSVLGGLIKTILPERDRLIAERLKGQVASVNVERLVAAIDKGGAVGLAEVHKRWSKELEHAQKALSSFSAKPLAAVWSSKKEHEALAKELELESR